MVGLLLLASIKYYDCYGFDHFINVVGVKMSFNLHSSLEFMYYLGAFISVSAVITLFYLVIDRINKVLLLVFL